LLAGTGKKRPGSTALLPRRVGSRFDEGMEGLLVDSAYDSEVFRDGLRRRLNPAGPLHKYCPNAVSSGCSR
jgi:hypothetical protein